MFDWSALTERIPSFGSGLGYRREIRDALAVQPRAVDFLEILTDQFIADERQHRELGEICATFVTIPHGVGLSVGSSSGLDLAYLRAIKRVSDLTGAPYYSEHLCMTRAPGIDIGHLSPMWFTEEILGDTIRNVTQAQDYLEKPLVLENVTYLFDVPNSEIAQADFFRALVQATGCGILLDLTNIYINAVNHGEDAVAFLDAMPLEHVVQVHLAGGYWADGILIDGHSEPVQEESWSLLEELTRRIPVRACIIEHDSNFPPGAGILFEQVKRARQIQTRSPALAAPG